jgi:hypothetical protein
MRLALYAFILTAAASSAAFAEGAYATASAADAAACARVCNTDSLCMAWSFAPNGACALRATMPGETPAFAWGLSPRAPNGIAPTQHPAVQRRAAPQSAASSPAAELEVATTNWGDLLLGGPEN